MYQLMEDFSAVVTRLQERQKELNRELQQLDLQKEDICHFLSLQLYTGPEGARILKQFTSILRKRRLVKEEQRIIDNTLSHIPTQGKNYYQKDKEIERSYMVRTDALLPIFGEVYSKNKTFSINKALKRLEEADNTEE